MPTDLFQSLAEVWYGKEGFLNRLVHLIWMKNLTLLKPSDLRRYKFPPKIVYTYLITSLANVALTSTRRK